MDLFLWALLKMEKKKDMDYINIKMEKNMKGNSKMAKNMEKEK